MEKGGVERGERRGRRETIKGEDDITLCTVFSTV